MGIFGATVHWKIRYPVKIADTAVSPLAQRFSMRLIVPTKPAASISATAKSGFCPLRFRFTVEGRRMIVMNAVSITAKPRRFDGPFRED